TRYAPPGGVGAARRTRRRVDRRGSGRARRPAVADRAARGHHRRGVCGGAPSVHRRPRRGVVASVERFERAGTPLPRIEADTRMRASAPASVPRICGGIVAQSPSAHSDVVFVDGVRTPFGRAGEKGQYWNTRADDLIVKAMIGLLERNPNLPKD